MPYSSINPMMNQQRNAITQALMNVQNPQPRTAMPQMPGAQIGAPTQSPIVPSGVAANPAAPGVPGAGGAPSPFAAPPTTGPTGQQPFAPPPGGSIGAPTIGPPQMAPPPIGGVPIPPVPPTQNLVGQPPPQAGMIPGTQLPLPMGY
jgi:hypothetical protein